MRLIINYGYSITKASKITGIYYPTAKAINKTFRRENRIQKRSFRYRTKDDD